MCETYNIITLVHSNKANGNDDTSGFFLYFAAEVLAPVFCLYFDAAIDLGVCAFKFKTAEVIPMLESSNNQIFFNCRPISLLPNLSKILEKFIKTLFINLFKKRNLLKSVTCFILFNMVLGKTAA